MILVWHFAELDGRNVGRLARTGELGARIGNGACPIGFFRNRDLEKNGAIYGGEAGLISIDKTSGQLLEEAARMIGTDVAHLTSAF